MIVCRCIKSPLYYPFKVGDLYLYQTQYKHPDTNDAYMTFYDINGIFLQNFNICNIETYFMDIQEERNQKLNEILN